MRRGVYRKHFLLWEKHIEVGMEQLFITDLTIEKVRHLKDISIPLSENRIKHLILTGKNGSGKTSVVDALSDYLNQPAIRRTEYLKRNSPCM